MSVAVPRFAVLLGLTAFAGCGGRELPPVTVTAPGVANPELDLHRALDDIRTFLSDFNGRLPTPARASVALQVTQPIALIAGSQTTTAAAPFNPSPEAPRMASRMTGRDGTVWFAYRDGTPHIGTRPGTLSLVWLQAGETVGPAPLMADPSAGWSIDLIPGKRGIHAAPAIAIRQATGARKAALHITTSKRSYAIMLDPDAPAADTRGRFSYSADDPSRQPDISAFELSTRAGGQPARIDTLRVTGPAVSWRPMRVYRDGGRTYIQFPPGGINLAPRLVVVSPADKAAQNYHTVGDSYVIDRLIDDGMLIGNESGQPTIRFTHGEAQ